MLFIHLTRFKKGASTNDIPMVHQDDDYDNYVTLDTSRIDDETSFIEPDTTEATSTLRLRQKGKRDKINALYRHLM